MKTQVLLETMLKVMPAVDSKSVVAQTDHFIFGDQLLSAYNGKIAISTPIDLDINCSVPGQDLLKIIKSVDDEDVELVCEKDVLHITSNDMKATLSTNVEEEAALIAISNFDLTDLLDGKGEIVPDNFIEGLELCIPSASRNADDPKNCNCIHIDGLGMYSGDGYRATRFGLSSEMDRILIPLLAAVQLSKFDPTDYSITTGWMHLLDENETVFSLRVVNGDFPDINSFVDGFTADIHVELPEYIKGIAASLGTIAESPIENFKALEIEITGEEINCHVEKSGVYATKTVEFPGNDTDASFLISASMLVSILEITREMELNAKMAKFSGENFEHLIVLMQAE